MTHSRRLLLGFSFAVLLALVAIYNSPRSQFAGQSLPEKLSDSEFWSVINECSEPGGYFRSDNFVSNESTFQRVIPELYARTRPGGIYLGVGPDQNFTYIAAMHPKFAFIVDIRRQNLLEHLMYKALFEMSDNRADFLSKLFARPLPPRLPADTSTEKLFEIFNNEETDQALAKRSLAAIHQSLLRHSFVPLLDDSKSIEYVYNSFVSAGPDIRYSFPNQYAWRRFPSYAELMLETDENGENHSYLASEANFQTIKKMESENRILPLVGDFAGEKALRSLGKYLKVHHASVTAFYTSNVEFYLFQTDDWRKFFNNVAELPVDEGSVFLRAYFNNYDLKFPTAAGARSITLVDNIPGLLGAFDSGRIRTYLDVVRRSMP